MSIIKNTYNVNGIYKFNINIVNDDTILNLINDIVLEYNKKSDYNITPDFLYVYNDNKPINFKYINTEINYDFEKDMSNIDPLFVLKNKPINQFIDYYNTKLINNNINKNINYVCLLDILDNDEEIKSEYYYGFIKKYWPSIKKKKSLKEYIELSNNDKNTKYIKNIENIKKCSYEQIDLLIENIKKDISNKELYKYIDIKNDINDNNKINILKLFYDLHTVKNKIPFIKLVLNDYSDSYYKIYEKNLKDNIISKNHYEKWIKGDYIYINNFIKHKNYTNTLVIIHKINNVYVSLEISKNGDINLIIKDTKPENINDIIELIHNYIKQNISNNLYGKITNIKFDYEDEEEDIYTTFKDNDIQDIEIELLYNKTENKLEDKRGNIDIYVNKKQIINFLKNNYTYVDINNENEDENIIKLKYKRVDDYFKLDNIEEQIIKLYNNKIKGNEFIADIKEIKREIIDIIKQQFLLDNEETNNIVDDILENMEKKKRIDKYNNELFISSGINPGADIIIYLRPNSDNIKIDVVNIKSEFEKENIISFLNYFIGEYKKFIDDNNYEIFNNIQKCNKSIEKADIKINKLKKQKSVEPTQITDTTQSQAQLQRQESLLPDSEEDDSDESDDDIEVFKGGAGELNKRLKNKDKDLFAWKQKDYPNIPPNQVYSKLCQNSHDRLPVVVTNDELDRINNSEELGSGRKSYGDILKVGSTEEKKLENNYICPIYWDTNTNLSLDPNNLPDNIDELIKKKIVLKRKHSYWRTAGEDVNRYVPIDTSKLETPWIHPKKYGMPCCFDKITKEKKNKINKGLKEKSQITKYLDQFPEENFNKQLPNKYKEDELNNIEGGELLSEQIKKIKKADEYIKLLENVDKKFKNIATNEINRLKLINNEIECKEPIKKYSNTFGFTQKSYNNIFNLLIELLNIKKSNIDNIFTKDEEKIIKESIINYYNDNNLNKDFFILSKKELLNAIDKQINYSIRKDKTIDKYESDNIYSINYEFLKILLKKYLNWESDKESDYKYFITFLDKRGYWRGKLNDEIGSKSANKDIWTGNNYGLQTTLNEATEGKNIHKLFIERLNNIEKFNNLKEYFINLYGEDFNDDKIYYYFRELYKIWIKEKNINNSQISKLKKNLISNKQENIDKDIIEKSKDENFVKYINNYFEYYLKFCNIMNTIYYGPDMKLLRNYIQNIFINHKKQKKISVLKNIIIDKISKKDNINFRKAGNGEIYNAFNINKSTPEENYINYINAIDIDYEDKYILPIITQYNIVDTNFIVYEEVNGLLKIKNPFDKYMYIKNNDNLTLILKNGPEYKLLYYNFIVPKNGEWTDNNIINNNVEYKSINIIHRIKNPKVCSEHWLNKRLDIFFEDIESNIQNIPSDIENITYTIKDKYIKDIIKNKKVKYYVNSLNKISHIIDIDDKNKFYPIYPCGLKEINNIKYDDIINNINDITITINNSEYIKNKGTGYNILGYIFEDSKIVNILFLNNTYIPVNITDNLDNILGYRNLFKLDNDINNIDFSINDFIKKNAKSTYDILNNIDKSNENKDKILKEILNNVINKPDDIDNLLKNKTDDNINKIYNLEEFKNYKNKDLYKFIDLLYKYKWPTFKDNNYNDFIYITPSNFKNSVNNEEIIIMYEDYENNILNKYYNKNNNFYKTLNIYNDNEYDDYIGY